jgi:hypothetical protein
LFSRRRRIARREWHQHHSELRSDGIGLRKDSHDFGRSGVSGDVIIGWLTLEQKIPHATPAKIRLKATIAQGADDVDGVLSGVGHVWSQFK